MKKNLLTLLAAFTLVGTLSACGPADPSQNPDGGKTKTTCNDNKKEGTEVCDGTDLGNKSCTDFKDANEKPFTGGTLSCKADCGGFDTSQCTVAPAATCNNNNAKEGTEVCDGTDLDNKSCTDFKDANEKPFTGGTLSCNNCAFDTSACTVAPPPACNNNNTKEGTEECDGTDFGVATCQSLTDDNGQHYTGGTLSCNQCQLVKTACTSAPPWSCPDNTTFFGQADSTVERGGGTPTEGTFTDDTGISGTRQYFDAPDHADWTGSGDIKNMTLSSPIEVTGITVTATGYPANKAGYFYVQDSSGAYFVRVSTGVTAPGPNVGDKVSFKIKKITLYHGLPQVAELSDFSVVSNNNSVYYEKYTGQDYTIADAFKLIRVQAKVASMTEDKGKNKGDMDTASGKTLQYRVGTKYKGLAVDKCVTYFGPLSFWDGRDPILDVVNFDWLKK